jgi:hypothetical protein
MTIKKQMTTTTLSLKDLLGHKYGKKREYPLRYSHHVLLGAVVGL